MQFDQLKPLEFIALLGRMALVSSVVCCCFASSPVQAIECLSAPDHSDKGWWSWREINSRKCWYKKVGEVPPKSEFRWPEDTDKPRENEMSAQQRSSSMQAIETVSPRIEVVRVKALEIREPDYRLGRNRVGLFEAFDLSGARGIGAVWEAPAYVKLPADTFATRYGQW